MKHVSKSRSRVAVSALFFTHGLCFSTWGSRIPAIQSKLGLSEAALGTALFALPVGLIISMPLTSWLIQITGSRKLLGVAISLYALSLVTLGLAPSFLLLIGALFIFGMASNMVNVAANTQAVAVESLYGKSIMASFHGLWSSAGFTGAALGTLMIGAGVIPFQHFLVVLALVLLVLSFNFNSLVPQPTTPQEKQPIFAMPDKSLLQLGLIAFASMTCEGTMFDWSGVYFKKVVLAENAWVGVGYTAFMSTMAGTRFIADKIVSRYGLRRVLELSGGCAALGYLIAVLFPKLPTAVLGFLLIGAGVSAVVPLVFGAAGKSTRVAPSTAIAAVSTIGFIGFLIAPPLVGWIAQATSLRISFLIISFAAMTIPLLARKIPN